MLYTEAVADIDRGYWEVGREKAELTALQKKGQKKEVRGRREGRRGGAEKGQRRRREGGREGRVGWGGEREEMREERKESEEGRIEELRGRWRKEGK